MPSPQPRLAVAVAAEIQQKLRALAALHHRTTSGEASAALQAWIETHAEELAAAEGAKP